MIDAQELRLGNYVLDSGGKVLRIDFFEHLQSGYDCKFGQRMFLASEEVHPMTDYTNSANPIPLTEQWLIDFGFEKSMTDYSLKVNEIFTFYVVKNEMFYFCPSISIGWSVSMLYVHHLQNIYSSLTGKELTKK